MRLINILLMMLLLIPLVSAVIIEQDDIIISSQETYYCQNIISDDGCLFKTSVTVQNNKLNPINAFLEFDANKDIVLRDFKNQGLSIAAQKSRGKNIHSQQPFIIGSGQTETYNIDFYSSEDGKFNFSIFYSGTRIILDPFFNLTINATSPSLHLIDGINNTIQDFNYSSTSDIAAGLSDGNDNTSFLTNNKQNVTAIYKFDEGSGSVAEDSSGNNNDGVITGATHIGSPGYTGSGLFALDFDGINDFVSISDAGNQFQFGNSVDDVPFTMMAWINITDMTTFRIAYKYVTGKEFMWGFTGGDNILLWLQDHSTAGYLRGDSAQTQTALQGQWFHLTTVYNGNGSDEGIQHYINGTAIDMSYLGSGTYVAMEDTGEDVNVAFGGGSNYGDGAIDELYVFKRALNSSEINNVINNGLAISTNAIKANFNITLDSDNDYWLRTRKTSSGVDDVTVYLYENGTAINTSLSHTQTITTGWDIIQLNSIIRNGSDSIFRFFTHDSKFISEVQLIEGINDSVNPVINSFAVNDTVLNCNGSIRLSSNVTDDNFIDTVFFLYNDNTGSHYEEADKLLNTDTYFIDKSYFHASSGVETFNFTLINASDLAANYATQNPSLSFNYSCSIDVDDPPLINVSPLNGTVIDKRFFNQTVNFSCTDDKLIFNMSYDAFNSSGTVASGFILGNDTFNRLTDSVDISNFATGDYFINRFCYDNNSQSDESLAAFSIVDVSDPFINSPSNNSALSLFASQTIPFSVNVDRSGTCDLVVNGSIISSDAVVSGNNDFSDKLSNGTYVYQFDCVLDTVPLSSGFHLLSVSVKPDLEDSYSIFSCPINSLPRALMFMFFLVISFAFVLLDALVLNRGIFGTIGALMMFTLSLYFYACIVMFAFMLSAVSVLLISYFVFNAFKN